MTISRLYFGPDGPNTVDIIVLRGGLDFKMEQEKETNVSTNGTTEIINQYGSQRIRIDTLFASSVYRDLQAWWSWARQGKTFSFTMDSTKVGAINLAIAAASGQKNITVNLASAFSATEYCLIKAEDNDDEFEIVQIDSISGQVVTVLSNLIYSYTTDDIFRHWHYWPKLISADHRFDPVVIAGGRFYKHTFEFIEGDAIVSHGIFEDTSETIWQDTGETIWIN